MFGWNNYEKYFFFLCSDSINFVRFAWTIRLQYNHYSKYQNKMLVMVLCPTLDAWYSKSNAYWIISTTKNPSFYLAFSRKMIFFYSSKCIAEKVMHLPVNLNFFSDSSKKNFKTQKPIKKKSKLLYEYLKTNRHIDFTS